MNFRPFLGAPALASCETAVQAEAFPVRLLPRLGISFVTPDSGPVTGGAGLGYRWDGWRWMASFQRISERGGTLGKLGRILGMKN